MIWFFSQFFITHYQHQNLDPWAPNFNPTTTNQLTLSSRIAMSSNTFQSRDHHQLYVNLYKATPVREINQMVYLSHQSTAFYLYISNPNGRLYSYNLSIWISIIFTADFLVQDHITTTIRTNGAKFISFWILLVAMPTQVGESSYMVLYLVQSMFISYIF